ncbi:MAG: RNA methyltransferase [Alphaproteobacteria bacterium]|nr:RNA methyltransferase [Alphaproteobacteria bacterium]
MAGTDRSKKSIEGGPSIILVEPQLGENIGTAARAMLNFGLTDLRLVRPRDKWPSRRAAEASSGADRVVEGARVFATTREAITDLHVVYATTTRQRNMRKAIVTAEKAALDLRLEMAHGRACGVLFGAERMGLENDDISIADVLIEIPSNPAFSSLNLAQAVLIVGYEWLQAGAAPVPETFSMGKTQPAAKGDLLGFFEHIESELIAAGFLFPPHKAPVMMRNLRTAFTRARLTDQEVRTLRGVIKTLTRLGKIRSKD